MSWPSKNQGRMMGRSTKVGKCGIHNHASASNLNSNEHSIGCVVKDDAYKPHGRSAEKHAWKQEAQFEEENYGDYWDEEKIINGIEMMKDMEDYFCN